MSELTRHLGQAFVINLASRPDRREDMGKQLRKAGLGWDSPQVTLFPAVRPDGDGGFESIGAHGCFRSHLGVIDRAVAAGTESILILEDDCQFSSDFNQRMPAINEALLRSDWSLFYGGWYLHGAEPPRAIAGQPIHSVAPQQPIWLTHCVAIRGPALKALPEFLRAIMSRPIGHPDGGRMDVDGAYSWLRRLNPQFETCIAVPPIAYQRSSRTDIGEPTWRDKTPVLRDLVAAARKLRNLLPR